MLEDMRGNFRIQFVCRVQSVLTKSNYTYISSPHKLMTTAYITDPRVNIHTLQGHPEFAGRLQAITALLEEKSIPARMHAIQPEPATDEQIQRIHTNDYLKLLAWTTTQNGMMLGSDTYALPESYDAAKLSAGAAIAGVESVLSSTAEHKVQNALVVTRPPGHHAVRDMGMGFCLLANVAIAIEQARHVHGLTRIAVVDYDVHHGNGTQDIFYGDSGVLFISTHRFPHYPGSGRVEESGTGAGKGYTINLPFPAAVGDTGYRDGFMQVVIPALQRYQPELIIVSAGMDAHWDDPLSGMGLSLTGYAALNDMLMTAARELCDGRIVFVQEGGYNLQTLSYGFLNIAYALIGDSTVSDPVGLFPGHEPDVSRLLKEIRTTHGL